MYSPNDGIKLKFSMKYIEQKGREKNSLQKMKGGGIAILKWRLGGLFQTVLNRILNYNVYKPY